MGFYDIHLGLHLKVYIRVFWIDDTKFCMTAFSGDQLLGYVIFIGQQNRADIPDSNARIREIQRLFHFGFVLDRLKQKDP